MHALKEKANGAITPRAIHLSAALLIGLTCLSTALSYLSASDCQGMTCPSAQDSFITPQLQSYLILAIVLMTMVKGIQIVDVFMEMRVAPVKWRRLLLTYPIVITSLLSFILYS